MRKITLPVSTPKKTLSGDLLKETVHKALAADTLKTFDAADRPGPIPEGAETDAGTNGESSRLTPAQQRDADVVAKLSPDFPKQSWDSMSYKAQLQAMKFSGLTEQEQWQMLNLSAPLGVLDAANRERIRPIPTTGADKDPEILTNPSKTPYLQNGQSEGQLGKDSPLGPVATPKPGAPLPQIDPVSKLQYYHLVLNGNALTPLAKSELTKALEAIDGNALSSAGKHMLALAIKKSTSGSLTAKESNILRRTYTDLKREETRYLTLAAAVESSAPSATWDSALINNQTKYSNLPGTFGKTGNLKDNGCGYIAIHNAKQLLGDHAKFIDTYFELNNLPDRTRNLGGSLGMNTSMISEYFGQQGYRVTGYSGYDSIPLNHDAYIVAYIYFLGAHYIAVKYDVNNKQLVAYNDGGETEIFYSDFSDLLGSNDASALCIWGIDNPSNAGEGNSIPHMQEK